MNSTREVPAAQDIFAGASATVPQAISAVQAKHASKAAQQHHPLPDVLRKHRGIPGCLDLPADMADVIKRCLTPLYTRKAVEAVGMAVSWNPFAVFCGLIAIAAMVVRDRMRGRAQTCQRPRQPVHRLQVSGSNVQRTEAARAVPVAACSPSAVAGSGGNQGGQTSPI